MLRHGDHVFGLPGLLLSLVNADLVHSEDHQRVIEVIGPKGLRNHIRRIFIDTDSRMRTFYTVHELWNVDGEVTQPVEVDDKYKWEILGKNIGKTAEGVWVIPDDCQNTSSFHVYAAELRHSIFCVGFVIQEREYPGRMIASKIPKSRLLSVKNRKFMEKRGIRNPMSILRDLRGGKSVELVDGILRPEDVMGERRRGRRVTILGDTCDSRAIARIAVGSDVLIHECTNAYIPEMDKESTTKEEVEARTFSHGHSTPLMAGKFARAIRAKKLILTHFSRRYRGDHSEIADSIMKQIVDQTIDAFENPEVYCAHDFENFKIPSRKDTIADTNIDKESNKAYTDACVAADEAERLMLQYYQD